VVIDAARACGFTIVGIGDDNSSRRCQVVLGVPVSAIGLDEAIDLARRHGAALVIAIGDNAVRRNLAAGIESTQTSLATVIHPSAVVAQSASIGRGSFVAAAAVLNPRCRIGAGAIVNTGATVDHDCDVGAWAHLAPGVHLGGTVSIGEETIVGVGASVRNNIRIGARVWVGVGAAVVRDIPDDVVAYGVPARIVRRDA
jgi:sugar O-acyltransferase (sialic acid O-acetyltransferase NeuD family)